MALRLARAGRTVALVDGASFPRGKVCGEGVLPPGVAALDELGVLAGIEPQGQRFQGVRYHLPDGSRASGCFPGGASGLGIARGVLDAALVDAGRAEANVDLQLGAWVQGFTSDASGVEVRLGDALLRAPVIVGADGGRSAVRRVAGLEARAPKRERFGVGVHVDHPLRGSRSEASAGTLEPRVRSGAASAGDPDGGGLPHVEVVLGPGCELYLTPLTATRTGVAVLLERAGLERIQGDLDGGVRSLLRASGGPAVALADAPFCSKARALGPLALGARAAHAERVALVGDAAGALDPISGEGIALGLVTARELAEELEGCFAANDFSARRLAGWTRRRSRALRAPRVLTATLLHLSRRPKRARRAVRALARTPAAFDRLLGLAAGAPPSARTVRDGLRVALGV